MAAPPRGQAETTLISPYEFYHTRGMEKVWVVHEEGDDLNEVGVFYLTHVAAELGVNGKSYEAMLVFFERLP